MINALWLLLIVPLAGSLGFMACAMLNVNKGEGAEYDD